MKRRAPALPTLLAALAALAGCAHAPPAGPPAQPPPAPLPSGARPAPAPAPTAPVRTLGRATFAAVGDVLMHEAVKRSAETFGAGAPDGGYAWLFEPVADLLAAADVAFANLETPIAPRRGGGVREFLFNATADVPRALRHAGIDVVAVANNHAFDQGRAGFEETLGALEDVGLRPVGAGPGDRAAGPVLVEAGGIRIAFLAWSQLYNQDGNACSPARRSGSPCVRAALLDRERAVAEVAAAAAGADAVIVSLHWGDEYRQQPRPEDVDLAHRLADAGATVVVGHHPHVLQPVEVYRRADGRASVIAYSLGNFISNQSRRYVFGVTPDAVAAPRDGALLRVELVRRDYGRGVMEVEVGGAGYVPLWTENDTAEIDPRREPRRRPRIRVVAVERALAEVRAAMAGLPDPVPPDRRREWIRLRSDEALLSARREAIAGVLGPELELPAPPRPGRPAPQAPPTPPTPPAPAR